VYDVLKARYPALAQAGEPDASRAELLITQRMDGEAFEALSQGKSVLLIELAGPAPGVGLGWWVLGTQAGTAIADHPAFGDFPHDGYLNHLFFRLVKSTVKCRDEEYRTVEKLMVNDGDQGYLAHVFQARASQGRLLACGLDLLSENVEAVYLLDQFINYMRSPWFAPRGLLDVQMASSDAKQPQS